MARIVTTIRNFNVLLVDGHLEKAIHIPTERDATELLQDIDWSGLYEYENQQRLRYLIENCDQLSEQIKQQLL